VQIEITVRDGRMGRDPTLVTDAGGEVLQVFMTNCLYDVDDRLTLGDGAEVYVASTDEVVGTEPLRQTLVVGDPWEADDSWSGSELGA
jgi:hypothetical protein